VYLGCPDQGQRVLTLASRSFLRVFSRVVAVDQVEEPLGQVGGLLSLGPGECRVTTLPDCGIVSELLPQTRRLPPSAEASDP
jgi:hypothetical protein